MSHVRPNQAVPVTPLGDPITFDSLPPENTSRWVARRKAQVVAAVQIGLLTIDEALMRYKLSLEEFTGWQRSLYRYGLRGLQITHLQGCKLADQGRKVLPRRGSKKTAWSRQHV